ncbi:hypothetical protein ACQP2P_23950 [Dactylosporangium sp. CA-139114]|uniref:hypothetical protein n=1 Tax=Dactylosporangium sp. CA-139114 TaxID=3239931 RepID=UPI003D97CE52
MPVWLPSSLSLPSLTSLSLAAVAGVAVVVAATVVAVVVGVASRARLFTPSPRLRVLPRLEQRPLSATAASRIVV